MEARHRNSGGGHADAIARVMSPAVVGVQGPSRSGKTSVCTRLIEALQARGHHVAYVKRTHHPLDLPHKASGRVWAAQPAAMLMNAVDRLQVSVPAQERSVDELLAWVPDGIDLVLLETHTPLPYPTIRSTRSEANEGTMYLGTWDLDTLDDDVATLIPRVEAVIPADRTLGRALRDAVRRHGGHACPGIVLGTRMGLLGAELVGVTIPDRERHLHIVSETHRCALDALEAVTGCRPGARTLRIDDQGKFAATFYGPASAVRVNARPGLREAAHEAFEACDGREAQVRAYLDLADAELFAWRAVDRPASVGAPRVRGHVLCDGCGEEVSDGRQVETRLGVSCRECAASAGRHERNGRGGAYALASATTPHLEV